MAPPVSLPRVGGGGGGRWWRARHGAARVHAGRTTPATIARGHAPRAFGNMGTNSNSKAATVVAAVDSNSNSKAAKAAAPAAPAATVATVATKVASGGGTTLAAGQLANVHGVVFVAPVAGTYHAPRIGNAGWPAVPAGSAVHVCDAVQLATDTTPAMPASVVVHAKPANAGTTGGGALAGHYVCRPYVGGQRWQLHPGAPKV